MGGFLLFTFVKHFVNHVKGIIFILCISSLCWKETSHDGLLVMWTLHFLNYLTCTTLVLNFGVQV